MMIKVYGASDDLIEIEGDIRKNFIITMTSLKYLAFSDGTLLEVVYVSGGIWRITPLIHGSARVNKTFTAVSGNSDDYSDIVELEGDIQWVVCGKGFIKQ